MRMRRRVRASRRLLASAAVAALACMTAAAPAGAQPGALTVAPTCIPFASTPFHFEAHQVTVIGDTAHLFAIGEPPGSLFPEARISNLRMTAANLVGDVSGTAELLNATHPGTYELRLYAAPSPTFGESAIGSIRVGGCPPPAAQIASMIPQVRALGLRRLAERCLVLELRVARLFVRASRPRLASPMLRRFEADAARFTHGGAAALRAQSAAIRAALR